MAIQNSSTPDANEVNKVILKPAILSLANSHKNKHTDARIFGANGGPYLASLAGEDYIVDGMTSTQFSDDTNTTCLIDNEDEINLNYDKTRWVGYKAYICKVLDKFNDSSVDTNIWTTSVTGGGIVTENAERLLLNCPTSSDTAAVISDGIGGLDLKALSDDSEFVIHFTTITNSTGAGFVIQISNGSTHVAVHTITGTGSPPDNWQSTIKVKVDKTGENAYISVNGSAFGSAIDISSVTTNWYIRMINTSSSSSGNANIYFIGYIDEDGSTIDYVSADKTFSATKTAGVLTWDTNSPETIVGNISSNGGTNYTTATENVWTSIGTTSTTGKIKLTMTTPTTIDATDSIDYIYEVKAAGAYFDG
jgi:hypothetical protein